MRIVESYYRFVCGFPVVFFEAWKHQNDDDPLVALLMNLRELPGVQSAQKGALKRALKPLLASGVVASELVLRHVTGQGLDDIGKALKLVEECELEIRSRCRDTESRLGNAIRAALDGYHADDSEEARRAWSDAGIDSVPRPPATVLVLLIDDLDRMLTQNAFRMIETLRFHFDLERTLVVMGANDKTLEKYVVEHFSLESEGVGERFLDKIFQLVFELPYAPLNNVHLRGVKDSISDQDISVIRNIFADVDAISHRKWIKLLNRLEHEKKAASDADIRLLAFISALKELYPQIEQLSRRYPGVLSDLYSGQVESPLVDKAVALVKKDKSSYDSPAENYQRLCDAIRASRPGLAEEA